MAKDLEQVREILNRFFRREKRLPTYQEMRILFGYSSTNASYKLAQKLIDAGMIEKGSGGRLLPKQLSVPLKLLGAVQAGFPSPAEEELLDTLSLDSYLIQKPQASFLLRVSGDSMTGAGIEPGDLVIIERGHEPKTGQIVLAQIDGEWTLKYYERKGREVRLIAANPKYPPLLPQQELTVGGIVRGVVRRYDY